MTDNIHLTAVKHWLEHTVINLNLCPFAKREFIDKRIRFTVTDSNTTPQLLQTLQAELTHLEKNPDTVTTLIIHPQVLQHFDDYNDFLDDADALLKEQGFEGHYQIASFHPHYHFSGTQVDDAENYTNRSPYPLLHILREQSVEKALASYPNPEQIPERNIALMNKMGTATLQQQLQSYFKD
jgi:hypothetical protein